MESKNQLIKLVKLFSRFSTHLSLFVILNAIFWTVWLLSRPFDFYSWPVYIFIAWLVILVIHYITTYNKFRVKK